MGGWGASERAPPNNNNNNNKKYRVNQPDLELCYNFKTLCLIKLKSVSKMYSLERQQGVRVNVERQCKRRRFSKF